MLVFAVLAVVAGAPLEGNGGRATELRPVVVDSSVPLTSVRRLDIAGAFRVRVVTDQDKTPFVEVTAEQNLLPHVTAVQKKDTLILRTDVDVRSPRGIVVVIHLRQLERIKASGEISFEGDLRGNDVVVEASGASDLHLGGAARSARFDIKGAGKVDAGALVLTDAVVVIGGACDVTVNAKGTVEVKGGGVGAVHVKGGGKVKAEAGGVVTVDEIK